MSTLKSSAEDLTLNADGSGNDIKFQSNAVEKGSLTDGGVWIGSTFEPTGDTAASDNAAIGYTAAEGLILTGQGSTDDVTIKNDADTTVLNVATGSSDIEVSAGDLIFGTAGKGICLGVTSNTDANTLDDYEEGTWTPALRGGDTAGSPTYHGQVGHYTKIGRVVTIMGNLHTNNLVDLDGIVYITGLPFTTHGYDSAINISYAASMSITAGESLVGNTAVSSTEVKIHIWNSTAGTGYLDDAEFTNGCHIVFSGTYHT